MFNGLTFALHITKHHYAYSVSVEVAASEGEDFRCRSHPFRITKYTEGVRTTRNRMKNTFHLRCHALHTLVKLFQHQSTECTNENQWKCLKKPFNGNLSFLHLTRNPSQLHLWYADIAFSVNQWQPS